MEMEMEARINVGPGATVAMLCYVLVCPLQRQVIVKFRRNQLLNYSTTQLQIITHFCLLLLRACSAMRPATVKRQMLQH